MEELMSGVALQNHSKLVRLVVSHYIAVDTARIRDESAWLYEGI
jgi:hypothetical protein